MTTKEVEVAAWAAAYGTAFAHIIESHREGRHPAEALKAYGDTAKIYAWRVADTAIELLRKGPP